MAVREQAYTSDNSVRQTMTTKLAGEDLTNDVMKVEGQFNYLNIVAGRTTTTVKTGAGLLHAIIFNSVATATNTTTVYDNTAASGTKIATITPVATTTNIPQTAIYDVKFSTGLTLITETANGADMTIVYR